MCLCVEKQISNVSEQLVSFVTGTIMGDNNDYQRKKSNKDRIIYKYGFQKIQEKGIRGVAMPKLSQLYILRHERATLIGSSTIEFGNECIRLVNIVLHTSQIFPTLMSTCENISQYLRTELIRRHPHEHFHIIIGENKAFSFAISDNDHFVEIKQEQYRVLIFSTKPHTSVKLDTHNVNNQMKLKWKSVVIKQMNT